MAIPDCDLAVDDRTVVRPDLTVVPLVNGRYARTLAEAGRPLLVVEILSPSSTVTDREAKRSLYLRLGIAEYWIVDISARHIERWRPGAAAEQCTATLTWRPRGGGDAMALDLADLFALV